jgi:hypothetical protein
MEKHGENFVGFFFGRIRTAHRKKSECGGKNSYRHRQAAGREKREEKKKIG